MALYKYATPQNLDKLGALLQWKLLIVAAIPLLVKRQILREDIGHGSRNLQLWVVLEEPLCRADEILYEQAQKLGFPPVLLVDWRPIEKFLILFILDNEVAEQITKPSKQYSTSVPKHPAIQHLAPIGEEWKGLRKRILPGFQPQHLLSLVKIILDKSQTFLDLMEQKAATGEEFYMDEYTTNLAFDVIGIVAFDMDLNAQIDGKQSDVLLTYRALSQAFNKRVPGKHWLRTYFNENEREIRRLDKKLDGIFKEKNMKQYKKLIAGATTAARSVATLSLYGIGVLTPEILQQTSDTLRGFLFAGHDTTSILLQWCFYELYRCPASAQALNDELDQVFGADPTPKFVIDQLLSPEAGKLLGRLPYTDAIIKETLRLHPPGTTARVAPKGSGTTLTLPNRQKLVVDNLCVTPRAYVIQRHPKIFGENKDDFMPERWLGEEGGKIPDSAFRPYERGPRRCIGSELANLEVRIVLACVARYFEFVKIGQGELDLDENRLPVTDDKGFYKTKSTMFSTHLVTAKPVDGMKVKVHIKHKALRRQ